MTAEVMKPVMPIAARKAGTLGERRDINARKIAAFGKFAGKRLAKGALRAKGPAIAFLELGQASSLLLSLCAIAQCEYYCTPCAPTRKGNILDVTKGQSLCHIQRPPRLCQLCLAFEAALPIVQNVIRG